MSESTFPDDQSYEPECSIFADDGIATDPLGSPEYARKSRAADREDEIEEYCLRANADRYGMTHALALYNAANGIPAALPQDEPEPNNGDGGFWDRSKIS